MVRRLAALLALALLLVGAPGGASAQQRADVLRNQVNQGTVSIISGGVNGTYIRIASDLGAVLDKGDELRILPILGKGSLQNITDILYLRGIDVGIVQSDVLSYIKKQRIHPNIENRIRYITKLYNEEVHLLAAKDIASVKDLAGRKVNVDVTGSGTSMTATTLFDMLGVKAEPTNYDQALALEKLKSGEIAAMVYVSGKPTELFRKIPPGSGLHFLEIPLTEEVLATYIPSSLAHDDYPDLVPGDKPIDTVAVGAVMAVYNWEPESERYRRVSAFTDAFFGNFDKFLQAPRHPKWKEVNLAASVPGWTRFAPAEEWLARNTPGAQPTATVDPALRQQFEAFLKFMEQHGGRPSGRMSEKEREAMLSQFMQWKAAQRAP